MNLQIPPPPCRGGVYCYVGKGDAKTETKRNDPCPRFSSADKGHFCSILVSNILCISSYSTVYLLLMSLESVKSNSSFFSNRETVVSNDVRGWGKRRGFHDLDFLTTHWLSSLGSDSVVCCLFPVVSRLLLCSDPVVFCWSSRSRSSAYFAIGLYLLCCDYSIAYFFPNCNIQNVRN